MRGTLRSSRFWFKVVAAIAALALHALVLAMVLHAPVLEVAQGDSDALDVQFVELGPALENSSAADAAESARIPEPDWPVEEVVPSFDPPPEPSVAVAPIPEPEILPEPDLPLQKWLETPPEPAAPAQESEPVAEPEPEAPIVEAPPKPAEEPERVEKPKPTEKPKPAEKSKPVPKPKPAEKPQPVQTPQTARRAAPDSKAQPNSGASQAKDTGGAARSQPSRGEPTPVDPDRPRTIGRVDYLGKRPNPVYPRVSQRRGEQGRVVLRVLISPLGQVADAQVRQSSGHKRLDDAALDAIRKARFKPYTENGIAYKAMVDIPFDFVL